MYELLPIRAFLRNFTPLGRSHTQRTPALNGIHRRLVLLLSIALCCPSGRAAAIASARTAYPHSVKEVAAAPVSGQGTPRISRRVLRADELSAPMPFEVGLRMRNFDEMQARIARGELISPAEKEAKYFPLASDHDRVVQWLKAEGFEVTRTDPDRLAIFARGTVDAVGKTFQVTFARVVTSDGEFSSAVTAPSLPSDISPAVLGIHGLQPHIRRHSLSAPRAPGGGQTINLNGYTPAQISAAYNATGLSET